MRDCNCNIQLMLLIFRDSPPLLQTHRVQGYWEQGKLPWLLTESWAWQSVSQSLRWCRKRDDEIGDCAGYWCWRGVLQEKIESSQEEKLLHGFLTCVLFSWRILGLSHFPRRGRGKPIVDSLLSSVKGTLSRIGALQLPSRRKSAKWERKSADFVINCWQSESDQHPHSIWLGTPRRKLV